MACGGSGEHRTGDAEPAVGAPPNAHLVSPAPGPPTAAAELLPGEVIERPLADGETHAYRLWLAAGSYLELVAEQRGADLLLALDDPAGDELIAIDSPTGATGEERLVAVTSSAGEHRVEVRALRLDEGGGGYALRIDTLRPAGGDDNDRFAAFRLLAEAELLRELGDRESVEQAVVVYGRALAAAEALGDLAQQARIEVRLGWVHRKHLDRKREAIPHYRRAAALFAQVGDSRSQASSINSLGRAYFHLGELDAAREAYERALPLWRGVGADGGEVAALSNLALIYFTHGDSEEALGFYDRAVERLQALDDRFNLSRAFYNRGRFYRSMGEERLALDDLENSLAVARSVDQRPEVAAALAAIGRTRQQMGDPAGARELLEQALALRRELGQERGISRALIGLASVDAELGREQQALAALGEALGLLHGLEAPRDDAVVLTAIGTLLAATDRPAEAREPLRRGLALYRDLDDPAGEAAALLGLARAERELGDLDSALRHATAALERLEAVRAGAVSRDLQAAFFARQQDPFDFLVDLLMELHSEDPSAGHAAAALAISERSRARSLLESLSESGAELRRGADPELLAREREIERRLAALSLQRDEPPAGETSAELEATLGRELRRLLRELDRVRTRIRAASPRHAALTQPEPLTAAEIQRRVLDEATALVELDLGPERSYLWLVTREAIVSRALPPRTVVEVAARRAHELLAASRQREAEAPTAMALASLADLVLGPVAGELAAWAESTGREAPRLLVVADGALHYVPFAALPLPAAGPAAELLVDRFEVTSMPSASSLAVLERQLAGRRPAPGAVAILADPVVGAGDPRISGRGQGALAGDGSGHDLPRLVHSHHEAEAIADLAPPGELLLALDFDADRRLAVGGELGRYRFLHLATHGELDATHPELSRLVLSRYGPDGEPRDGRLFAHEIYGLELPAELVTLSACRTALGAEVRGEGLVGLTQAFFYAGAARVLVSLWQVDDEATAELMSRFYTGLWSAGLPPAAALRRAQLSVRAETRWRAPYYWAGFVLEGV